MRESTLLKSWVRNDVWRCQLEGAGLPDRAGLPDSVIVKRFKDDPERGFDDWAALAFLTQHELEPPVAPRFLAGDVGARVFVMEDLGPGRTLEELLRDTDKTTAADSLVRVARLTGQLHARMLDHAVDFDARRESLAPRRAPPIAAAASFLRAERGRITAWLSATDVRPAGALIATIEVVANAVECPGPFATLTHGDMAPSNTHVTPAAVRLLDFEYAGVRHALYDTLLWTLVCPFPVALIERAETAYRSELARGCPAAREDGTYLAARAMVTAWRMLNLLQWLPPSLLGADQPWAPGVSSRAAILWHLERFELVASGVGSLVPLVETLGRLARTLNARWPGSLPEPHTLWPALREEQQL